MRARPPHDVERERTAGGAANHDVMSCARLRASLQVADEKRKWAVKHVNISGKPDKLKARRRIRPWEAIQDPAERVLKQVRLPHSAA